MARFRPIDKEVARSAIGLPLDRPILLWVGRLSSYDKLDLTVLLDSLDAVPDAVLVIQGKETEPDYFWRMVHMRGLAGRIVPRSLDRNSMALLYSASDVLVAPADSVQECFGLVVAEALACGTPVVASDWDGYRDLVRSGESGWLCATHWDVGASHVAPMVPFVPNGLGHALLASSVHMDRQYLTAKVSELLGDSTARRVMSTAARKSAEAFGWERVVTSLETLLLRDVRTPSGEPARPPMFNIEWYRDYTSDESGCQCVPATRFDNLRPPLLDTSIRVAQDTTGEVLSSMWHRKVGEYRSSPLQFSPDGSASPS